MFKSRSWLPLSWTWSHLWRDREELPEINLLEMWFCSFLITYQRQRDLQWCQPLRKVGTKQTAQLIWPFSSRSARTFMGADLSTHTISFKVSPQQECDALQEEEKEFNQVQKFPLCLFSLLGFSCSPGNCSQSWTKIKKRMRRKRGISFFDLW